MDHERDRAVVEEQVLASPADTGERLADGLVGGRDRGLQRRERQGPELLEDEATELGKGEIARVAPDVRRYIANRHPEDVLLIALGGAVEHVGRDGEAFAAWEDAEPTAPQNLPLPPDEPVKGA